MVKKLLSMVLVLTLVSLFAITSAEAGSKTRNGWPGAGIALGAILLGGFVAHQIATHVPPPTPSSLLTTPRASLVSTRT